MTLSFFPQTGFLALVAAPTSATASVHIVALAAVQVVVDRGPPLTLSLALLDSLCCWCSSILVNMYTHFSLP